MVKTPHFHHRGRRFNSGLGKIPHPTDPWVGEARKKEEGEDRNKLMCSVIED